MWTRKDTSRQERKHVDKRGNKRRDMKTREETSRQERKQEDKKIN